MNKRFKIILGLSLLLGGFLFFVFAVARSYDKQIVLDDNCRIFVQNEKTVSGTRSEMQGKIEVVKPDDIAKAKELIGKLRFRQNDPNYVVLGGAASCFQIFTGDVKIVIANQNARQWSVTIFAQSSTLAAMIYTLPEELNEEAKAFVENLEGEVISYGEGYGDK